MFDKHGACSGLGRPEFGTRAGTRQAPFAARDATVATEAMAKADTWPESSRWAAAKALVVLTVAWCLHAVVDLASLATNQNPLVVVVAGAGFGLASLVGVVQLVRALPPSGARAALLVVAFGSVLQASVFFFFYRPGTSRALGALSAGVLVAVLASVYATCRFRAPLAAMCIAAATSVTVGLFDAVAHAGRGAWVLDRDILSDAPVVAPAGTLLLTAALVAIFLDLRRQCGIAFGASPTKRPAKSATAPWAAASRFLRLYNGAFVAKLTLAVLVAIAMAAGWTSLPALGVAADLIATSVAAFGLARFGLLAPHRHVKAFALAGAIGHLLTVVLGVLLVRSSVDDARAAAPGVLVGIGAVAALALLLLCATLIAVGRDVGDAALSAYAKETAVVVLLGAPVTSLLPLLASPDLTMTTRSILVDLVPVFVALPLAGTLATFATLRRATWAVRAAA